MQRIFKYCHDFNSSLINVKALMNWSLMLVLLVSQQFTTIDAAKFKGDSCVSKNQPGICKEWGECPIIKTLIESGQYTNREVVSCGFAVREELICCPELRTNPNAGTTTTTNTDRVVMLENTTQAPTRDFWLDFLENTTTVATDTDTSHTTSTSIKPDFWLDLLTTTTTTKPTTIRPLIVGEQRLNESSEFFDLNALLSGKHTGAPKQERQVTTVRSVTNHNNDLGFVNSGNQGNGWRNLNSEPVNLNQWINDDDNSNKFSNIFRGNGNNGRGQGNVWNQNVGRGQGNNWAQNNLRGQGNSWPQNNGRGQGNAWGQNNGRGAHSNGRGRPGMGNQNRGFSFPDSDTRPNQFFENGVPSSRRPNIPFDSMLEQNTHTINTNLQANNNNNNENKKGSDNIEDLIKNVFNTSPENNRNSQSHVADQNKPLEPNVEETIASVFNLKPQTNSNQMQQIAAPANTAPVAWPLSQDSTQISQPKHNQQVVFQNPHMPGQFEIIPAMQHQMNSNDLEVAPSTSFIQQPVVVETWSNNPVQQNEFNPAQVVYENLLNSGIDIVKSNEMQHQQQQQQQFIQQPQVFVVQPQVPISQQFVQPPQQVFFQQPQHLIQQPFQRLTEQPKLSETLVKEPRLKSPVVQQTNTGFVPNIQSPPAQILDPFKPFEFRPPPGNENVFSEDNNFLSPNPTPTTRDSGGERPAVRACRRIEQGLVASLSPHILGGTPAELGEFPHMVAIGYSRIGGDDRPPYDIRCGGTLIDKRFVLTAAHCVSDRENVPTIVRLGVVNFTDPDQMSQAVELRIKETFIHDNYSTRLTYNDIAILELERDVETSEYIYPVCLYTNETDPDTKIKLWVTGWGTVNTTTRSFSDILLKAPLHTSPLENCNRSFTEYGLNRRIPEGIIRTQFCAEDKDQIKDACQGDSGGPLNLIVDESLKNYRLVGIVSSGFGCASSTPGLYTRVAAFLDFIEKIVWPNGGD